MAKLLSFDRDAAMLLLRSPRSCYTDTLCTLSLRPLYDKRASAATVLFRHSKPLRFCHASATLLAFWQLLVWFKCFPEVGVTLLNSRPTVLRIVSNMFGSNLTHVNENTSCLSSIALSQVGHRGPIVAFCLQLNK